MEYEPWFISSEGDFLIILHLRDVFETQSVMKHVTKKN